MNDKIPSLFQRLINVFVTSWQSDTNRQNIMLDNAENNSRFDPELIYDPEETLCVAIESLYLLAELAEIHFVKNEHEILQKRVIKCARHLAKTYTMQLERPNTNYVLEVEFESFARDLMTLKQQQLFTANGHSWCDIMRKPARTAAEAIQAYQKYYHSTVNKEKQVA